jgi:hypothetical protein
VAVVLVFHRGMRMCHIILSSVACLDVACFVTLFQNCTFFSKRNIEHKATFQNKRAILFNIETTCVLHHIQINPYPTELTL